MHKYEVGKLYNPARSNWNEAVQFNIRNGQCELLLFFRDPSFHETLAVKKSECEFGILEINNVIMFLYRFGSEIAWSDQPFSIHLVPENERVLPELKSEERLTLNIILVNARNGIIKAMRFVTLSPEFSNELLKLVKRQQQSEFNKNEYNKRIMQIYNKFPKSEDLVKECFDFTSGGI